ncbi:MAG: CinA family protein [Campylobacterales bacterium]
MKYSLILIGEALLGDGAMLEYIGRHFGASGIRPERTLKYRRAEQFFADVARTSGTEAIFVLCEPEQAALIAREIATFTGDSMRDDRLLPSRALALTTEYYKIVETQLQFHVMNVESGCALPEPDLPERGREARTAHLFDVKKSALLPVLRQLAEAYRITFTLAEPIPGWLQCRMECERFGDLEGALQQLVSQFPTGIMAENIALWLIESLERSGKTVTFAESCTGGLLSYYLTKESGASNVFEGALVTYSNRLKSAWIAVENDTLAAHGAVSREVVEEMSGGALDVSGADYAIAVSGIAGPTGGTPEKPVGTVHVAVRSKEALRTARLQLNGDRNYIQEQTVLHAVKMLLMLDKKTFFKILQDFS